jgi:ABC-type sugar transport system ATPase subunit
MSSDVVLSVRKISKRFPGVLALDGVSVDLRRGECHGIVGENGAGKSTLGKIMAGVVSPDSGQISLDGRAVHFSAPLDAIAAGISIVHQELSFCENLTVAENLCLTHLPRKWFLLDERETRRQAIEWLAPIAPDISPDEPVGRLPIAKQQLVQVAGAIGRGARILIFDEPTSSLAKQESDRLLELIRKLVENQITCVFVSHRLAEVLELCERVTVLRDGRVVAESDAASLTHDTLARLMIGRDLELNTWHASDEPGESLLRVESLSSPGKFADITLEARAGEIVGVAGLVGAGRTEVAEAIFGLDPRATGRVIVEGSERRFRSPAEALAAGVGLVPEDRKRHGLVLALNARENVVLPNLRRVSTAGFVRSRLERELVSQYFRLLRVKSPSLDAATTGLSGGNQQKLVLAKWLAAHCRVLIVDEPTRGVDVGAKAEIHSLLREFASRGNTVLAISSELPELLAIADRTYVMASGLIVGHLPHRECSEESLMVLMAGVQKAATA